MHPSVHTFRFGRSPLAIYKCLVLLLSLTTALRCRIAFVSLPTLSCCCIRNSSRFFFLLLISFFMSGCFFITTMRKCTFLLQCRISLYICVCLYFFVFYLRLRHFICFYCLSTFHVHVFTIEFLSATFETVNAAYYITI